MLGLLITIVATIGAIGMGKAMIGRLTATLDPAVRLAAHGLDGLAGLGFLTLFVGLLPGGLDWGFWLVVAYIAAGWVLFALDLKGSPLKFSIPKGLDALFLLAFVLGGLVSLIGVLSPSDTLDWDSLSYHLAVPKLLLQAGHIYPLFMHQSNFPSLVDYLYIWGLKWGGQSGAKTFSFAFYVLGLIAVYGFARERYGQRPGLWAALAFGFVPMLMWESGTAYIDLANGLFAGLGIAFAAMWLTDRAKQTLWLSALFLGYAAGSKYTGLQTILAVAIVVLALTRNKQGLKSAVLVGVVASAVACPWYIKNIVYTGNPVFPFFYERLGGKNWDQRRADIYKVQQQGFGIPPARLSQPASLSERLGSAVFGLAYKPWEYIDAGYQYRLGSIGAAVLLAFFLWLIGGRAQIYEKAILGTVLITLAMWVVLSQQTRYMAPLVLPLAVLLGGGVVRLAFGPLLAGVAALQAVYSLWVLSTERIGQQLPVALGQVSADDYQKKYTSFYAAAQAINTDALGGKVALYDETFGFLLDVPYMWANPGHSTEIPYDTMKTPEDYVRDMKQLGFTHAYLNLRTMEGSDEAIQAWYRETGLNGPIVNMPERDDALDDWQVKYKILIADAIAKGLMVPVEQFRSGILLRFQ